MSRSSGPFCTALLPLASPALLLHASPPPPTLRPVPPPPPGKRARGGRSLPANEVRTPVLVFIRRLCGNAIVTDLCPSDPASLAAMSVNVQCHVNRGQQEARTKEFWEDGVWKEVGRASSEPGEATRRRIGGVTFGDSAAATFLRAHGSTAMKVSAEHCSTMLGRQVGIAVYTDSLVLNC